MFVRHMRLSGLMSGRGQSAAHDPKSLFIIFSRPWMPGARKDLERVLKKLAVFA